MIINKLVKFFIILFILICSFRVYSIDTLKITSLENRLNIYKYISILEDQKDTVSIDKLTASPNLFIFSKNQENKLNYEFSTSTYWFKIIIENNTSQNIEYILEIFNPDLDYVNFYQISNNTIIRKIETGEIFDIKSKQYFHRNFLFPIRLKPNEIGEYYLSVNNLGHSITIPITLFKESYFNKVNYKIEIFNWLIYGLLFFILIFNFYLFRSTRDKINLYNAFIIFFAAIILFTYDGYLYLLNFPPIVEKFKWFYPSFYTIFLLFFIQEFTRNNSQFKGLKIIFTSLKLIALVIPLFYFFRFPVSLIADIGLPILILISQILLITIAFVYLNRNYSPSIILAIAFCIVFLGMFVHELKEMNVINLNFFVLNSLKISFTTECILLTITTLERFRIQQKQAQDTIQNNLDQIEIQNKELEIINTELEKLSIVVSETNNCVAIYDHNGRIEWCNTFFEEFYKITLYEIISSKKDYIFDIIPNTDIQDLFNKSISTQSPVSFETKIRSGDEEDIWAQTTLSPLIRHDKVFKLVAIDSDISKLKQYEKNLKLAKEKAIESDRLKSVFLGNMSHEIRTPLNGIIGFSELLSNSIVNEEKKIKYLQMITSNGEQLLRIIDDIVDISLIESNQLRISPATINLHIFLKETLAFYKAYKATVHKSSIEFILENKIKSKELNIVVDPSRLQQVLRNLINNALKFTNEGYVRLTCCKNGDNLQFCVDDSGIGLDPDKKEIIFERFRQADERLNREYGGTGLGLSISKGIVEKMKGEIWVDTKEDNGLKICFKIPYVPAKKNIVSIKAY